MKMCPRWELCCACFAAPPPPHTHTTPPLPLPLDWNVAVVTVAAPPPPRTTLPSQGALAKVKQLKAAFGTEDVDEVIKIILEKGELQVSGGERDAQLERWGGCCWGPCPPVTR